MAAYQILSDVIVEILVKLPVKTLLRFKSVCKDWYTLINSSLFIRLHLSKSLVSNSWQNRSLFYTELDSLCVIDDVNCPLEPFKLYWPKYIIRHPDHIFPVGSCNGLVCLCLTEPEYAFNTKVMCFLICNPITGTFKFKPNVPFLQIKQLKSWNLSYGFGYDGEHDDYKIVVTPKVWEESVRDDVYIYSCKDDLWKHATPIPAQLLSGTCALGNNIPFLNNMLHYLVSPNVQGFNGPKYVIARLDLSSESWSDDLSFPAVLNSLNDVKLRAYGALDGCLYLRIRECYRSNNNVWIMKRYGDEDSWSIKYNIPGKFSNYNLVAPSKEGSPLLLSTDIYSSSHCLVWYNPQDDTTEAFKLVASPSSGRADLCIASLVSIPGTSFTLAASPRQLRRVQKKPDVIKSHVRGIHNSKSC